MFFQFFCHVIYKSFDASHNSNCIKFSTYATSQTSDFFSLLALQWHIASSNKDHIGAILFLWEHQIIPGTYSLTPHLLLLITIHCAYHLLMLLYKMVQTIPKYSIFLCSYFPYTIYMVIQLKVLSCCLKKKVIYKTGITICHNV